MTSPTSPKSLQDVIDNAKGNIVDVLRNVRNNAYVVPLVPSEFTNWRSEQKAWRETAVLFDQSRHMDNLFIRGSDAIKLISDTGINSVANFAVNRAKQHVAVNDKGYVISDAILFRESEEEFVYVGRTQGINWLRYHAEKGGYKNIDLEWDRRSLIYPMEKPVNRKYWRFQIQGPNAWKIIDKLNGKPLEQLKFFAMSHMTIAGTKVRTLRHGMSGAPGLEIWGEYSNYSRVRDAIMEAGAEFGLLAVGARAYHTNALESAWIPDPLPAVYTGDSMRAYREWLPANGPEASGAIAGSFVSSNIEDYYLTPWALGYAPFIKHDHDFIGADALKKADVSKQWKKVTFAWNPEDFGKLLASKATEDELAPKYFEMPNACYGYYAYDSVTDRKGSLLGLSKWTGYSSNERRALSLGCVDPSVEIGAEVKLVWGEPNGGTRKDTVEPHKQFELRAIVSPAPYSVVARSSYHEVGWRVKTA